MITILSYGLGNVKAIVDVHERLNIPIRVASDPEDLHTVTKLVLPGVGSLHRAMELLRGSGMLNPLETLVLDHRVPVLGICVGMQMMASAGDEGSVDGLGWIAGYVAKLRPPVEAGQPVTPHMGWNSILPSYDHPIFDGVNLELGFYFLHSYHFQCDDPRRVLATCHYGSDFTAAVVHGNILGVQFHPEKSHSNGLAIFRNFAEL